MHMTFSWPGTAPMYTLSYYDFVYQREEPLQTEYHETRYAIPISERSPGLFLVTPQYPTGPSSPIAFPINEPPSLAALRWRVRATLNDVETDDRADMIALESPKWTDAELNAYIREGIQLFNTHLPGEETIEVNAMHLDRSRLAHVKKILDIVYFDTDSKEWRRIPYFSRRGYTPVRRGSAAVGLDRYWDFVNGELKLYGRFRENVPLEIIAEKLYPVPHRDTHVVEVPQDDWDILSIYVQAKAYMRLAGQSAQLDRWKEDGKRNDNPVTPIARMLLADAMTRIEARKPPRGLRRYRA